MPSRNTYPITWVSLTLDVGYLFMAAPYLETDWFQIGKGVLQGCILSPCLFNLYAEYIMRNTGLEEAQPLLLTLDEEYLLMVAPPDLELGVTPLGPPAPVQPLLLGCGVPPLGRSCTVTFSHSRSRP